MKIHVLLVGKTTEPYLKEGMEIYLKRLKNYINVSVGIITPSSFPDRKKAVEEEGQSIMSKLLPTDFVVVLDEKGKDPGSRQLADLFQKWMLRGIGRVVFIIGGPFGVSPKLSQKANYILSVSKLTFTHQMVRLILVEQIYRAMTILKNESYHHD